MKDWDKTAREDFLKKYFKNNFAKGYRSKNVMISEDNTGNGIFEEPETINRYLSLMNEIDITHPHNIGVYRNVAKHVLNDASKQGIPVLGETAMQIYKKLGMLNDNYVRKKLLESIENCESTNKANLTASENIVKELASAEKKGILREISKKSLEGALTVIGASLLLVSIFFLSNNLTGNAISNLTNKSINVIGIILFALGIGFLIFKRGFKTH